MKAVCRRARLERIGGSTPDLWRPPEGEGQGGDLERGAGDRAVVARPNTRILVSVGIFL